MFDVDFFYSSHAPDASLALLRQAGLDILLSEIDDPSSGGHLAILCRRPAHPPSHTETRKPTTRRVAEGWI